LCAARNGKTHHTDRFSMMKREVPKLVIRRGQVFKLQLHCNRPYNMERDAVSLILSVADVEKPSFGHGTLIAVQLKNRSTELGKSNEWGASVNSINGDLLEILIKPAANALVTQWKMDIDTKVVDSNLSRSFSLPQSFYLLFNPWCREDEVYLEGKIDDDFNGHLKFKFISRYFQMNASEMSTS
jgi:transglutaminase 1